MLLLACLGLEGYGQATRMSMLGGAVLQSRDRLAEAGSGSGILRSPCLDGAAGLLTGGGRELNSRPGVKYPPGPQGTGAGLHMLHLIFMHCFGPMVRSLILQGTAQEGEDHKIRA